MRPILLVLIALLLAPGALAAQANLPQAAGIEDSAKRQFVDTTNASSGVKNLTVWIARFDTDEHASAAIPLWLEQARDFGPEWDSSGLRPIGIDLLGDETQAITGVILQDGSDFDEGYITLLAVRVDATLYLYQAWSLYRDGVDTLMDVAAKTLGLEDAKYPPVPNVPYQEGGLFDTLPRIEDLPQGMTWNYDIQPCAGVLASTVCEDDATPVASPAT